MFRSYDESSLFIWSMTTMPCAVQPVESVANDAKETEPPALRGSGIHLATAADKVTAL